MRFARQIFRLAFELFFGAHITFSDFLDGHVDMLACKLYFDVLECLASRKLVALWLVPLLTLRGGSYLCTLLVVFYDFLERVIVFSTFLCMRLDCKTRARNLS